MRIVESRRRADFVMPIPAPKQRKAEPDFTDAVETAFGRMVQDALDHIRRRII